MNYFTNIFILIDITIWIVLFSIEIFSFENFHFETTCLGKSWNLLGVWTVKWLAEIAIPHLSRSKTKNEKPANRTLPPQSSQRRRNSSKETKQFKRFFFFFFKNRRLTQCQTPKIRGTLISLHLYNIYFFFSLISFVNESIGKIT